MKRFFTKIALGVILFSSIVSPANAFATTYDVQEILVEENISYTYDYSPTETEVIYSPVEEVKPVEEITPLTADQTVINLLHINDIHGRVDVGIHYARLATKVQEYRANNANTLLFDAGDAIHGTNFANLFRGESVINLMNLIGFDAMVAGNHEFNFHQDRLVELAGKADFPILGANVLVEQSNERLLQEYTIFELDGVSVGVFGLVTPTTPTVTNPNNVIGLRFTDVVLEAQRMVNHLEDRVDVVVALTHLGVEGVGSSSTVVANHVEGIDVIIDGHCHTVKNIVVNNTPIVSVGHHAQNLGSLEIIVEDGDVLSVEKTMYTAADFVDVAHDPAVLTLLAYYTNQLGDILSVEVGYSDVFLNNAYVRRAETALGNLTTDLFLYATGADVALMNSGGIRENINQGVITRGDVFNVFPFGNMIEAYEVTGAVLLAALENGVSRFPETHHGRFPQVGGMSFTFDISQPAGYRISNLLIGGEPVQLDRIYTLATNGFVGSGGDGFTMIPAYGRFVGEFGSIDEVLADFLRAHGPISPRIEGRMIMRDADGIVPNPDWTPEDEVREPEDPIVPELENATAIFALYANGVEVASISQDVVAGETPVAPAITDWNRELETFLSTIRHSTGNVLDSHEKGAWIGNVTAELDAGETARFTAELTKRTFDVTFVDPTVNFLRTENVPFGSYVTRPDMSALQYSLRDNEAYGGWWLMPNPLIQGFALTGGSRWIFATYEYADGSASTPVTADVTLTKRRLTVENVEETPESGEYVGSGNNVGDGDGTKEVTPGVPVRPETGDTTENAVAGTLPQTGDATNLFAVFVGMLMIAGASVIVVGRLRKK